MARMELAPSPPPGLYICPSDPLGPHRRLLEAGTPRGLWWVRAEEDVRRKTTAKAVLTSARHGVPAQSCLVPVLKQSLGSGPCTLGQAEAC